MANEITVFLDSLWCRLET